MQTLIADGKKMDSPDPLSEDDIVTLDEMSQLINEPTRAFTLDPESGVISGKVRVPPFGVAVVNIMLK